MARNWVKMAGDAAQKVLVFSGIIIPIEWPAGSTRTWPGSDYSRKMHADYGYVRSTTGDDGEEIDVYVGPNLESQNVYEIQQLKDDGSHDELKYMLGYDSEEEATQAFLMHMAEHKMGNVVEGNLAGFKKMLPQEVMVKTAIIRADGDGYSLYSHKGKHLFGPASHEKCEERERQVEYFKHQGSKEPKFSVGETITGDYYKPSGGLSVGELTGRIVDIENVTGEYGYQIQVTSDPQNNGQYVGEKVWIDEWDIKSPRRASVLRIGDFVRVAASATKDILGKVIMIHVGEAVEVRTAIGKQLFTLSEVTPVRVKFATEMQELDYLDMSLDRLKEDKKETISDEQEEAIDKRVEEMENEKRKVQEKMAFTNPEFFGGKKLASDNDKELEEGNTTTKRSPASIEVSEEADDIQLDPEYRPKGFQGEGPEREIELSDEKMPKKKADSASSPLAMGGAPVSAPTEGGEGMVATACKIGDTVNVAGMDSQGTIVDIRNNEDGVIYDVQLWATNSIEPFPEDQVVATGGTDPVQEISDGTVAMMKRKAQVTVSENWGPDGTITRSIKFDEINGDEAQALMDLIHHAPAQEENPFEGPEQDMGEQPQNFEEEVDADMAVQPQQDMAPQAVGAALKTAGDYNQQIAAWIGDHESVLMGHTYSEIVELCVQEGHFDRNEAQKTVDYIRGMYERNHPEMRTNSKKAGQTTPYHCQGCNEDVAVYPGQEGKACPYCGGKLEKKQEAMQSPADQGISDNALPKTKSEDAQGSQENPPFKAPGMPGQNFASKRNWRRVAIEDEEFGPVSFGPKIAPCSNCHMVGEVNDNGLCTKCAPAEKKAGQYGNCDQCGQWAMLNDDRCSACAKEKHMAGTKTAAPFGSVQWQEEMENKIKQKQQNGEPLNGSEQAFMETQMEHNDKMMGGKTSLNHAKVNMTKTLASIYDKL